MQYAPPIYPFFFSTLFFYYIIYFIIIESVYAILFFFSLVRDRSKRMKKNIGLDYRAVKARPPEEGIRKGQIGLLDREEEKGHKEEGGQRPEKGYTRDNHQFSVVLLSVRCISWIII